MVDIQDGLFMQEKSSDPWFGWVFTKHPDGGHVSLRPATEQDKMHPNVHRYFGMPTRHVRAG